jgi:hypothetical protein
MDKKGLTNKEVAGILAEEAYKLITVARYLIYIQGRDHRAFSLRRLLLWRVGLRRDHVVF